MPTPPSSSLSRGHAVSGREGCSFLQLHGRPLGDTARTRTSSKPVRQQARGDRFLRRGRGPADWRTGGVSDRSRAPSDTRAGSRAEGGPAALLPLGNASDRGGAPSTAAHPAADRQPPGPYFTPAHSGPIGARRLLNMHAGLNQRRAREAGPHVLLLSLGF